MILYFELFIVGVGLLGFSLALPTYMMKFMALALVAFSAYWAAGVIGLDDCLDPKAGEYEDVGQFWGCVSDHLETGGDQPEQDVSQ
ncbi:hypothetical protein [Sulfitobacter mediterraneus]|uniref:hypothetical protein n=1 Tax=Sulfitobacter mediterraneus TaxID=83219 RepID=UPI000EA02EC9|nr:hypothetical protein [Sulfitobacter mediterraneus]